VHHRPHTRWIRNLSRATVLASLVFVGWLLGPRPWPDTSLETFSLPDDLEGWVGRHEKAAGHVKDGAQARIVRFDPSSRAPTPLSVVAIHGFSASRQETAPLAEHVAARLEANLFEARLTGHGLDGAALGDATAHDWILDAAEALAIGRELGTRVVLIGSSTGGTLILALLTAHPELQKGVAAVVLLSPNFRPADRRAVIFGWPWARKWVPWLAGAEHGFTPVNDAQARWWTTRYPTRALFEMTALCSFVADRDLSRVAVPVLVCYCPSDRVVDAGAIETRYEQLGPGRRELVALPTVGDPMRHVLAGDALSPSTTDLVADRIVGFVRGT